MKTATCQCDEVPDRPCPAAITQEDLLCDACRQANQPDYVHVVTALSGPTIMTISHGALDAREVSWGDRGGLAGARPDPGRLMTDERDADMENLRLLESFFLPLDPQDAAERARVVTGSGILTRDMIVRALGGEPSEGS